MRADARRFGGRGLIGRRPPGGLGLCVLLDGGFGRGLVLDEDPRLWWRRGSLRSRAAISRAAARGEAGAGRERRAARLLPFLGSFVAYMDWMRLVDLRRVGAASACAGAPKMARGTGARVQRLEESAAPSRGMAYRSAWPCHSLGGT